MLKNVLSCGFAKSLARRIMRLGFPGSIDLNSSCFDKANLINSFPLPKYEMSAFIFSGSSRSLSVLNSGILKHSIGYSLSIRIISAKSSGLNPLSYELCMNSSADWSGFNSPKFTHFVIISYGISPLFELITRCSIGHWLWRLRMKLMNSCLSGPISRFSELSIPTRNLSFPLGGSLFLLFVNL